MMQLPILVVEDEFLIALNIEWVLTCAGHRVVALAAARSEALAFADEVRLAFVDLNLSDGPTGPSIACDLAERGITIVYLTANPEQIDPVASTALGYICKPFDERALVAAASIARTATSMFRGQRRSRDLERMLGVQPCFASRLESHLTVFS